MIAWMKQAISLAEENLVDVPVGALIIMDGRIIASARNQREENNDPLGHAELIAIKKAASSLGQWRLSGSTLISTLEPCPMCTEAILQTRVSKLVFGAYDQKSGACGSAFNLLTSDRIYPAPEVIGGIEEEECSRILRDHFKNSMRQQR